MTRIARYVSVAGAVLAAGLLASAGSQIVIRPDPEPPPVENPGGRPTRLNVAAASDERLIDRETATSVSLVGSADILLQLEHAGWISSVKVFGPADGTIAVLAETGSGWQPVAGLTAAPLSGLASGWNELAATQPVFASAALVRWTPGSGPRRALSEIELWGPMPPAADGSDLRPLAASTAELSIEEREVSVPLDMPSTLTPYRKVYLTYELRGWQEWVSVSRSINGGPESGAAIGPLTGEWTSQVEEIDPAWLRSGANSVRFAPSAAATLPYEIRNVRLVGEVDTGRNAVDGTDEVILHSATATERVSTMTLDEATQVAGIDVYAPQGAATPPRIEALIDDVWETVFASSTPSGLPAGWSYLPLSERRPVLALRVAWPSAGDAIETVPVGSAVGSASSHPAIRVSYPTDGRYYGREAHLRGFLVPRGAEVWIAGTRVDRADGSFAATVSKDDLGLFDEADEAPWSVQVRAVYPNGKVVLRDVVLNAGRPGPESLEGRLLPPRSLRAEPGARKRMTHDAATLDVDAGSVDSAVDLSITPLDEAGIAALDQGMTNVTRGPRRGYRFQPHGMRFKKPVRVELPYDAQLIPPGLTESDIRTFYFDDQAGRWMELERVEVDTASRKIVSRTDHFTDMINATITVPDHAPPLSYNPNSIQGIEAADPARGINFVQPPQAGNKGDARLSYPIEVPKGRLGVAPDLQISYASSRSNGWVGVGWDLSVPSIGVDTKWGVPRYCSSTSSAAVCPDGDVESETYLFEGEQLTPVAHRAPFQARSAEKVFRTRVEREFRKIVRHGDHPANYTWEVTDTAGTRFFFGGAGAVLKDAAGNVFHWALVEMRDLSGNGVRYEYDTVSDPGIAGGTVAGTQLYLKRINYTQSNGAPGPYTVTFLRDTELPGYVRRPDVTIDARGGFKMVTAELLKRIEIDYGTTRVRSYDLAYVRGPFEKTLLESVTQRGTKEQQFHVHRFQYYDDVRQAGAYVGFQPSETWDTGADDVRVALLDDLGAPLGFDDGKATALSGYETEHVGAHAYVGFNPDAPTKQGSFGFKYGAGGTVDSTGLLTLIDLDGDRLPDKVFRQGDDISVRLNRSGPHGTTTFGPPIPVATLPSLGRENTFTTSYGVEKYVGFSFMANAALSFTTTPVYFSDVNGDGLTDLVDHGTVLFNRRAADGTPTFTPDSATSPVPIGPAAVDGADLLPDYGDLQEQALANSPLADTVRRWIAPFSGTVQVTGDVQLGPPDPAYRTADGVRVAIQHNGTELWSELIDANDGAPKTPTGVNAIAVAKGDRIYFRVHSRFDGRHDAVAWDPRVVYTGAPVITDVNLLDPYRYQISSDFTLAGRRGIDVKLPFTGKIRLTGDLQKTGATTDDITLHIFKGGADVIPPVTLAWNAVSAIPLDLVLDVVQDERIELRVQVDSPIDLRQIAWVPAMHYLDNPLPTQVLNGVPRTITRVFDASGNPIVRLDPPYDIDAYSEDTLAAPQLPWVSDDTDTLTVHSTLVADSDANGVVVLTAKKRGELLAKRTITIIDGVVGNVSFDIDVEEDDQVFFDYSCFDPDLAPKIGHRVVEVTFDGTTFDEAPSAFRNAIRQGVFPQPYRGWAVVGYKGDPPRGDQPIVEADLVQDFDAATQYDVRAAKAFLFAPRPSGNRWLGPEEQTFATSTGVGSSRLGVDFVQAPTATASAGAQAPLRVSSSTQAAASTGLLFLSGSASTGGGSSDLDYIDMNGDQFPDVVGAGRVQYSPMFGGLETANRPLGGFDKPRETTSDAANVGVGGSPAEFQLDGRGRVDSPSRGPAGKENDTGSQMVTLGLGVSGSLGSGSSEAQFDLVDLNGDGLPDRVTRQGSQVRVRLNLGYAFAAEEPWGAAALNEGESTNVSVGPTLGFNGGIYDFAGGLSFDRNTSTVTRDLVDVNGDGLLDRLTTVGSELRVGLNTGTGFLADVPWGGSPSGEFATSGTSSVGGGVYFTVGIGPLCLFACYVIVNPGADASTSLARQETSLSDVDGDGYLDHLQSSRDDTMTVARNTTGRTNLLKRVERPLGAVIDLDYDRAGNTYDEPQSRWVLARVSVLDGFTGDGADRSLKTFRYEGGVYDRLEREFYGFGRVIQEDRDTAAGDAVYRSIEQEFATDSFYTSGLLVRQTVRDGAGRPFTQTENTYLLRDETTNTAPADGKSTTATEFPQLARVDKRYFEGQPAPGKATAMAYEYDVHGNTARVVDFADTGAADDVDARIAYSDCPGTHLFGEATSIEVKGAGATMRRREATVDCGSGDVSQVREYLENGTVATSDLSYAANGNLVQLVGPSNHRGQRYTLVYTYDAATQTDVAAITDSHGLASTTTYDPLFRLPTSRTDVAGNVTSFVYDTFGRTAWIVAPDEQGTGSKTILFDYHPEAGVPWARTRHLDRFRSIADTIDAVTFVDGLGRTLQIKNDATLHVGAGSTGADRVIVSGRVTFDAFGRMSAKRYPTVESLGAPGVFNATPDPVGPTTMAFDVLDRTTESRLPDGARTTTAYGFGADRQGRPQFERVVTDANGIVKRTYSDVRELIVDLKETNRGGAETIWTSYAYDPLRQISTITDDRGNVTRMTYDNLGRRTAIDNPDTGKVETVHDLAGNEIARVTPNLRARGRRIDFDHDFLRIASIHYPDFPENDVTYTYGGPGAPENAAGRVVRVRDESGITERGYGKLGQVVRETKTIASDTQGNGPGSPEVYTTRWTYDSFNRLQNLTYPDGELLTYRYDAGGLVRAASGIKGANTYAYVNRLEYDKFEERAFVEAGNGVRTTYAYRADNRRLDTLTSITPSGRLLQSLRYVHDPAGNVLRLQNLVPVPAASDFGGPTDMAFAYDDLYRLTGATGTYQFAPTKSRRFTLAMDYDTIHNVTVKNQADVVVEPSSSTVPQQKTSYAWAYAYAGPQPHAATHAGERTFTYDANGNQAGFANDRNGTRRTITWDEENRIQSIADNGHTETYKYDDDGDRVIKRSPQGETVYVNPFFTIRNREVGTKHVFVGETRLVSKLVKPAPVYEKDSYFYHGDHLGSVAYVTDSLAKLYEHIEYFPFGEAWIEEASNIQRTPYRFTSKELDEETALTYFGARYYDPRTSVWQSPDPQLPKYLPNRGDSNARTLPGQGGIYDPVNLALYGYAGSNPLKLKDADGLDKETVEKIAKAISSEMDQAWKDSFSADRSTTKEKGAAIVLTGGKFKIANAAKQSTSGNVGINTTDLAADEKLAGTFHTHPFGKNEGNLEGIAFSLDDIDVIGKGTKGRFTFVEAGSKRYVLEIVDKKAFLAYAASDASVAAFYKGERASTAKTKPEKQFDAIRALVKEKGSGLKFYQSVDKEKVKFEEVK